MQRKHLILSRWLQENTRLLPTPNMTLLQSTLNYSVYIVFYSEDDGRTFLTEKQAWWSQTPTLVRPVGWNKPLSQYGKSSGSQAPSVKSDQVKISSSNAAYKNMLCIPQRLITVLQSWRRANAMYIRDKEPKMISENQFVNPTTSLASYLPFLKEHFVFQQNSTGAIYGGDRHLRVKNPSAILTAACQGWFPPIPPIDLLSMNFSFLIILIILLCSLIFLCVQEEVV